MVNLIVRNYIIFSLKVTVKNQCHKVIFRLSLNPQQLIGKIFICNQVRPLLTQHIAHFNTNFLNNIFYLREIILEFGKSKFPLCLLCKSAEETSINLFSECLQINPLL